MECLIDVGRFSGSQANERHTEGRARRRKVSGRMVHPYPSVDGVARLAAGLSSRRGYGWRCAPARGPRQFRSARLDPGRNERGYRTDHWFKHRFVPVS